MNLMGLIIREPSNRPNNTLFNLITLPIRFSNRIGLINSVFISRCLVAQMHYVVPLRSIMDYIILQLTLNIKVIVKIFMDYMKTPHFLQPIYFQYINQSFHSFLSGIWVII